MLAFSFFLGPFVNIWSNHSLTVAHLFSPTGRPVSWNCLFFHFAIYWPYQKTPAVWVQSVKVQIILQLRANQGRLTWFANKLGTKVGLFFFFLGILSSHKLKQNTSTPQMQLPKIRNMHNYPLKMDGIYQALRRYPFPSYKLIFYRNCFANIFQIKSHSSFNASLQQAENVGGSTGPTPVRTLEISSTFADGKLQVAGYTWQNEAFHTINITTVATVYRLLHYEIWNSFLLNFSCCLCCCCCCFGQVSPWHSLWNINNISQYIKVPETEITPRVLLLVI